MSPLDWVLLGALACVVGLAVWFLLRNRKRGKRCCGDCSGCSGCDKGKPNG